MRLDQACAVGGHESRRRIVLPFALPPGAQRVEQARRDLAHQGARDRVLSPRISAADSLIRRICRPHPRPAGSRADAARCIATAPPGWRDRVLLPDQLLAFAHAGREDAGGGGDREEHEPKNRRWHNVDVDMPVSCCQIVCSKHGDRRPPPPEIGRSAAAAETLGSPPGRIAATQPACNAAAGVQQQHQAGDVDRGLKNGLHMRAEAVFAPARC